MKRLFCLLLLMIASPAGWAQSYTQGSHLDFNKGVAAAQEGNYAVAYCIWKPLADVGHAEAQYRLGWLYAKGLGLAVDEATAIYWWKQAAGLGHADSLFRLGWAYQHGEGTEKDMAQAMSYYLQAARHGQEDAIELLQLMLMRENKEVTQGIGKLLQNNPRALGEITEIAVARANVRSGANKNAKLLRTLKQGDALVVLGKSGNWLRIWMIDHQQFGWVFKRLVSGFDK
ncbi:MAG: SH3 domain-containing protein [Gammaproteobacteria bacterium]|nr:SH3 domain-containing protein [Gammaproteobacteria bacterium]